MTQAEDQFQHAKALEAQGHYAQAAPLYEALKSAPGQEIRARRRLTECLMRLQRWDEVRAEVEAVLAAEPPSNRDIKRWLAVRGQLDGPLVPADPVADHARAERAAGRYPEGPFILFTAAAPKTGSTSLSVALAAATGSAKINYLDLPPTTAKWDIPWWPAVDALEGCALVNHCHMSPEPEIIADIEQRPWVRVAVHLRNPFETMESTIDMILRERSPNLLSGAPHLALAPDSDVRDWVMTAYLPRLAAWMSDWVALLNDGHPSVIGPTTMDMMRAQGQDHLARHLAAQLPGVTVRQADTAPQRTGKRLAGDKKVRLTPAERDRVRDTVPGALFERFGWS